MLLSMEKRRGNYMILESHLRARQEKHITGLAVPMFYLVQFREKNARF